MSGFDRGARTSAARWRVITVVVAMLGLLSAGPAHAYLDAGSGSMMLQLLLGGVAGVGVVVRLYWRRVLGAFGVRRDDPTRAAEARADGGGARDSDA